jgi:hypothetical protein
MSATAIHRALVANLKALTDLEELSVSWENVPFTPAAGEAWLREKFAPDRMAQTTLGSEGYNRLPGIYMIDVFTPVGQGWKDAEDLAEIVLAAFPRGVVLTDADTGVQVRVERSYRTAAREEPSWFHVPVTVEFRADIQP